MAQRRRTGFWDAVDPRNGGTGLLLWLCKAADEKRSTSEIKEESFAVRKHDRGPSSSSGGTRDIEDGGGSCGS